MIRRNHRHPVRSSVQRQARLEARDFRWKRRHDRSGEIRRVGDHQIEATRPERLQEVTGQELHAPGQSERPDIARQRRPARGASARRRARGASARSTPARRRWRRSRFRRPRSTDAGSSRSDLDRPLHQSLRLRARDEHVGTHRHPHTVEFLESQEVLQGYARGPAVRREIDSGASRSGTVPVRDRGRGGSARAPGPKPAAIPRPDGRSRLPRSPGPCVASPSAPSRLSAETVRVTTRSPPASGSAPSPGGHRSSRPGPPRGWQGGDAGSG